MDIKNQVHVKFNQVSAKYQPYFSRPVYKFIRDILFGILCSGHVHLSKIGAVLREESSLKKTTERLSKQLGREGLAQALSRVHLEVNRRSFAQAHYLIVDLSDFTKLYAEKMEGLGRVYDGSTGELSNGYWQLNIIGVDQSGSAIMPMFSSLYATDREGDKGFSENKKILESVDVVSESLDKKQIVVFDRGGDRGKLIYHWLKEKQHFIIRQTGERDIYCRDEQINLRDLAVRIRLRHMITVDKRRGNRIRKRTFRVGARQVYMPKPYAPGHLDQSLWLVSAKEPGKGWSWHLCFIPVASEYEAVHTCMQGYGYRWKIEEVNRQVKSEYHLEHICLRRYTALKNFNVLFWMAMSFVYQHLEGISIDIMQYAKVKLVYRSRKLKEYLDFVYYKLARALKVILLEIKLRKLKLGSPASNPDQLGLLFE